MKIKVLMVDDHALFRDGMHYVLQQLADEVEVFDAGNFVDGMKEAESTPSPNRFWRKLGIRKAALKASAASELTMEEIRALTSVMADLESQAAWLESAWEDEVDFAEESLASECSASVEWCEWCESLATVATVAAAAPSKYMRSSSKYIDFPSLALYL